MFVFMQGNTIMGLIRKLGTLLHKTTYKILAALNHQAKSLDYFTLKMVPVTATLQAF
jgi:hypothetical protein